MSIDYLAFNLHLHSQLVETKLLLDETACRSWPCSGWLFELSHWATQEGIKVVSGDEALTLIHEGIEPKRIAWIQDGLEKIGTYNEWRGKHDKEGVQTILFNMESPLFNPQFWDVADELPAALKMGVGVGLRQPTFPAYRTKDLLPVNPEAWGRNSEKWPVACVFSNKWQALMPNVELLRQSPSYRHAIAFEQQTDRFRELQRISLTRPVVIAGQGFEHPSPFMIQEFARDPIRPVADKLAWLNQFPYTLVLENTWHPYYSSEKEFDAIVAGSLPVFNHQVAAKPTSTLTQIITRKQYKLRENEITHPASELRWVNEMKAHIGLL